MPNTTTSIHVSAHDANDVSRRLTGRGQVNDAQRTLFNVNDDPNDTFAYVSAPIITRFGNTITVTYPTATVTFDQPNYAPVTVAFIRPDVDCALLQSEINAAEAEVNDLQSQLAGAGPSERQLLMRELGVARALLNKLLAQSQSLGCG